MFSNCDHGSEWQCKEVERTVYSLYVTSFTSHSLLLGLGENVLVLPWSRSDKDGRQGDAKLYTEKTSKLE